MDAATLPSNIAAQLWNRDVDVKITATFLWGVLYIVGTDPESGIPGLAGRQVYSLGRGSTPDLLLRYLLGTEGIDPEADLTIAYGLGQIELSQLLIAGRIDAAVLPEPFVTRTLSANEDIGVIAAQIVPFLNVRAELLKLFDRL